MQFSSYEYEIRLKSLASEEVFQRKDTEENQQKSPAKIR